LEAETGDISPIATSLEEFFIKVNDDIEGFLSVGLDREMDPGELLLAYPPFVCQESGTDVSLNPAPAEEVIRFHADLAKQIRDLPDGARIEFKFVD